MIPIYLYSANNIYENVAIDEALFILNRTEPLPAVRIWEQKETSIVLGKSQKAALELNLETCLENHIPIARRCSAGGAVIQQEGSYNFVFSFPVTWNPILSDVRKSFQFFAEYVQQALATHHIPSGYRLLSDITDGADKKISGNAQSRSLKNIMHHGTLLAKPCTATMLHYLAKPSTEPEYRQGRTHEQFVTSLLEMGHTLTLEEFALTFEKIIPQSQLTTQMPPEILEKAKELIQEKYQHQQWNLEGKRP